ncbi:MAG: proton-conducting transporter membrane subunit, partial [Candidatus Limnocylindrales bacterium]
LLMPAGESRGRGAAQIVATPVARGLSVAAAAGVVRGGLAGAAHGAPANLPLATTAGGAARFVAVTVTDPGAALLAVTAAGLAGVASALGEPVSMPILRVAADGVRLVAVAGLVGLAGVAVVGAGAPFPAPEMVGTGVLAVGAAAAIRLGATPLHIPAVRVVETARLAALPLVAVWLPAGFALIGLDWVETTLAATGASTPVAHLVLAVLGALTIAVAGVAALLDDDLARLFAYGLIADGGFVVLAAASSDPAAFPAARTWIVCLGLSRTVLAVALLELESAFGTRHVNELAGWLRRMPLTGLALLASVIVGVGLPTMLPFEARRTLAVLALGGNLGLVALAFGALPVLGLARLAWVGSRPAGAAVAAGSGEWPIVRPETALPLPARLARIWQLDRLTITAALTLLLGLLALLVAFGVGGLSGAAGVVPPAS